MKRVILIAFIPLLLTSCMSTRPGFTPPDDGGGIGGGFFDFLPWIGGEEGPALVGAGLFLYRVREINEIENPEDRKVLLEAMRAEAASDFPDTLIYIDYLIEKAESESREPTPAPAPQPPTPPQPPSDSAVALTPGRGRGYEEAAEMYNDSGNKIERASRHDTPAQREGVNSWRPHYYWDHSGQHYAAGHGAVYVRPILNQGRPYQFRVPNPALRYEFRGSPENLSVSLSVDGITTYDLTGYEVMPGEGEEVELE